MSESQNQVFESTQKQGKSTSQVFWLRIMNDIIRPRFLKVKEKQQNQCMQMETFEKFMQCYQYQADRLQEDSIEMEFFARKFDKCVEQGRRALYPMKRVEEICSNKIINVIKDQKSIRRAKEKQARQEAEQNSNVASVKPPVVIHEVNPQESKTANAIKGPNVQVKGDDKYVNGHKLTWQEKKSLEKFEVFK